MAAGRHAGYRSNEFRARNAELEILRKREFYIEGQFGDLRKRENPNRFLRGVDSDRGRFRSNLVYREIVELSSSNKKLKFSTFVSDKEDKNKELPLPDVVRDSFKVDVVEVFTHSNENREFPQMEEDEEEEYVTTRNISSSRWAQVDDNAPTLARKLDEKMPKMTESPELGEVVSRESSGRAKSNASESDREDDDRSSFMDIDREDADRLSETNYEEDGIGPQRPIDMLQGCRSVDEFEKLNKINEGTYGVVFRAKDKKTGEIVALKKVKMEKEREGFPLTSLREINILLSFHHPCIVDVKGVVTSRDLQNVFLVMEYMEHDLKGLMGTMKQPFSQSEVKCLMYQLLLGVKYLHDNWVLHRDLKTSNLLFNNRGELKICDFGLSRQYGSPLKPYTQLVVTLWYRSPELLLGAKEYSTAVDMWSLGCIMAELLGKKPLFDGKTEVDQLDKIFAILGNPTPDVWPGISELPGWKAISLKQKYRYSKLRGKFPAASFSGQPTLSEAGFSLLTKLLTYDPERRITAEDALNHEWFREVPLPKSKEFMPTFPAQHTQERHATILFC